MKALVLCGGLPQIELMENLRRRGIETVLADMNPNCLGRPYADRFYPVSTMDIDGVRALAEAEQVDFLIAVCADQVISVVARISEELGLPCYLSYETSVAVSQKSKMKELFVKNGVPTSRYVILRELSEEAVRDLHYPLIVKPVDSYSSKGVHKCRSYEELAAAFPDSVAISRTQTAVVEEFAEGRELSVDVYVENGKAHVLCISRLDKIAGSDRFVIYRTVYPAEVTPALKRAITRTAQKIADGFGLKDSPMLIQLIASGDRLSVIEFCARTGGGDKFRLIKKAAGFDVIDAVAELTLGRKPHVGRSPRKKTFIVNEFLYCKQGVYDHLEGFAELQQEGIISEYFDLRSPGTAYSGEVRSSGDRVAYFTVEAGDREELLRKHHLAAERIRVIASDGSDMLRRDLVLDFQP